MVLPLAELRGGACLVQRLAWVVKERLEMASMCLVHDLAQRYWKPRASREPCCVSPNKGPTDIFLGPWQR